MNPYKRFWDKVQKTDGCWLWTAGKSNGYGMYRPTSRTQKWAHRMSWELHFGLIPDGLCVCHRCDTPACVRPDHLFLGTKRDNSLDRHAKGRDASGERNGAHIHRARIPRGDRWRETHRNPANGERSGQSKLTEAQVLEIRAAHADGTPATHLAKLFGVSSVCIDHVVHRKTWRHI